MSSRACLLLYLLPCQCVWCKLAPYWLKLLQVDGYLINRPWLWSSPFWTGCRIMWTSLVTISGISGRALGQVRRMWVIPDLLGGGVQGSCICPEEAANKGNLEEAQKTSLIIFLMEIRVITANPSSQYLSNCYRICVWLKNTKTKQKPWQIYRRDCFYSLPNHLCECVMVCVKPFVILLLDIICPGLNFSRWTTSLLWTVWAILV